MRILLDENMPHRLRTLLQGHDARTTAYQGWAGLANGALLMAADGEQRAVAVVIEDVLRILTQNVATAQRLIVSAIPRLLATRSCPCAHALRDAIITDRALIPAAVKQELGILVGKYLGE